MAIKSKYRIKNSDGTYDIMHFETSSEQVLTTDGKQFVSNEEKSAWNNKSDSNHNHDTMYPKKFKTLIGDGQTSTIKVTHNLNTEDITISIFDATSKELVFVETQIVDENSINVLFSVAPTASQYKVIIIG